MRLHKFIRRNGARAALTHDRSGANLPSRSTPWIYDASMDVAQSKPPQLKASLDDIMMEIETNGYYLWPIDEDDL